MDTPIQTLPTALEKVAIRHPCRVALISGTERFSYRQLWKRVKFATSLLDSVIAQRERSIAICLGQATSSVTWLLAVMRSGRVAIVPPQDGAQALPLLLQELSTSHVITSAALASSWSDVREAIALGDDVVLLRIGSPQPSTPKWLLSDSALVLFTSGTSGTPKAVLHSHQSLLFSASRLHELQHEFWSGSVPKVAVRVAQVVNTHRLGLIRAARGQTWMTDLSLSTIAGFTVLVQALFSGHTFVLCVRHAPRELFQQIQNHRVSVFATVPAVVRALVNSGCDSDYDLSSLLMLGVGGGFMAPELVATARKRFRCEVAIGYGSTELGGGVLVTRPYDSLDVRMSTVGRPFPGVEVGIRDERGRECSPGVTGELWCKTPGRMVRYVGVEPQASSDGSDGSWFKTGDIAISGLNGMVCIVGRSDDMIIRGGRKIAPSEIESRLMASGYLSDAAVAGVRDTSGEDAIHAWVVPVSDATFSKEALRSQVGSSAPAWLVPQYIHVMTELPKAQDGEVRRHLLVDRERNH